MKLQKMLFCLAIIVLLPLAACQKEEAGRQVVDLPMAQVEVETVNLAAVPFQIEVAGTIEAVEHALVSSRVSGQIVEIPVRAGSKVKKGDLLVRLSAAEIDAKVRQAKTQVSQAQRNLQRETSLQKAQASTPERVLTLKEQLEISEAGYRQAKAMLDYTVIRAPFAATVTRKIAQIGDLSSPGSPLLQLENGAALEVVAQVPEAQAQDLHLGEKLPVVVPAAKLELQAAIREISPTVDSASRTTQVKITLPNDAGLRSGQFARVALPDRQSKTILIPEKALFVNGQMELVYVAAAGRVEMRLVRSAGHYGQKVEILSGLREGEELIIGSHERLHDGQPLEIIQAEPQK